MNDMDSYGAIVRDFLFDRVPGPAGTFLNLSEEYARTAWMIKVEDVRTISVLLPMTEEKI
jgi:hypothetical protein